MTIIQLANGKLVHSWNNWDQLAVMEQLGLMPGSVNLSFSENRLAGKDSFDQFSFFHQHDTAHQQILNADARLHRVLIRCAVAYRLEIEDDHVGVRAFLQAALEAGCGS